MLKIIIISLRSVSSLAIFGFVAAAAMSSTLGQILLIVLALLVALFAALQWEWSRRYAFPNWEPTLEKDVGTGQATGELQCKTAP